MIRYRRKPIEVDAWQYDGSDTKHQETWPKWLKQESESNLVGCWDNGSSISLVVGDYDDPTYVHVGNYIIKETGKPLYVCYEKDFSNKFEEIND